MDKRRPFTFDTSDPIFLSAPKGFGQLPLDARRPRAAVADHHEVASSDRRADVCEMDLFPAKKTSIAIKKEEATVQVLRDWHSKTIYRSVGEIIVNYQFFFSFFLSFCFLDCWIPATSRCEYAQRPVNGGRWGVAD